MTPLERRAALLLCVGFPGDDPETCDPRELAEFGPGGIIVFARNVTTAERTRALVGRIAGAIEARTGVRPFAGVDQEGGRVARFRSGATALPSMMALGAADDAGLARAAGRALAFDVRRFGCDVDFAPDADLALRACSRVVGTRSFGDDPARAGALATALAAGLAEGGVAAVVKHAPGHGATGADSHDSLPVLDASAAELAERDLVPFCQAVAGGVRAVMFGHVVVPEFGPEAASSNPRAVAFVRERIGGEPLLMTDCLQMDAIAKGTGTAETAARAIAAGIDVAIVSHDLPVARDAARAIARDVASGAIPEARFEAALAAAARFRAHVRSLDAAAEPNPPSAVSPQSETLALEIARAAITTLRSTPTGDAERVTSGDARSIAAGHAERVTSGDARSIAAGDAERVAAGDALTIVSFESASLASAEGQGLTKNPSDAGRPSLALALRHRRVRAEMMRVPLDPGDDEREALELVLGGQGARPLVVIARGARHYPGQVRAIGAMLALRPDALVVCAGEPFDLAVLGGARRVLCTYGDGPAEMEALADVVTGRAGTPGRVPVRLTATAPASVPPAPAARA